MTFFEKVDLLLSESPCVGSSSSSTDDNNTNNSDITSVKSIDNNDIEEDNDIKIDNNEEKDDISYFHYNGSITNNTQIIKHVVISSDISLPNRAFRNCYSLETIRFDDSTTPPGKGLEGIGNEAFEGCELLHTVTFSKTRNNIIRIGRDAFFGCTSLKRIDLPSMLREVGERTFANCTSLKYVTLPDTMSAISENCFRQCISLECIQLSSNIQRIHHAAFLGCCNLRSVLIPSVTQLEEIGSLAFLCCSKLTVLELPISSYKNKSKRLRVSPTAFYDVEVLKEGARRMEDNNCPNDDDDDVCTFLQRRFRKLPLHRLLYHRYEIDLDDIMRQLKQMQQQYSVSFFQEKDQFGMTGLDILSATVMNNNNNDDTTNKAVTTTTMSKSNNNNNTPTMNDVDIRIRWFLQEMDYRAMNVFENWITTTTAEIVNSINNTLKDKVLLPSYTSKEKEGREKVAKTDVINGGKKNKKKNIITSNKKYIDNKKKVVNKDNDDDTTTNNYNNNSTKKKRI
eukprot:CAMPEP_0194166488 /NCGR_PEP_ID=MMETSP0154-20130528/2078_1 /TAXON_ID=1049557 /ORGANISM="Thalassiothrix antarctica, Strain L6-D1" /LENGTH=509 /DNA_ID=CAMNT_0038877171 /DNA_START=282 /DNA_END=1810 /DNA_ORIENTATION=-